MSKPDHSDDCKAGRNHSSDQMPIPGVFDGASVMAGSLRGSHERHPKPVSPLPISGPQTSRLAGGRMLL